MTTFEFGDIIMVPFPFIDQTTGKKRPAVVIGTAAYNTGLPDNIIMAVTSQTKPTAIIGEMIFQVKRGTSIRSAASRLRAAAAPR